MAIAVVAQGQRSENLLDFDDEPTPVLPSAAASSSSNGALAGLDFGTAAGAGAQRAQQPAAAKAQPANSIDDLMGLFDQAGLGPSSQPAPSSTAGQPAWATMGASPTGQQQQQQAQKKSDMDLMGDLF